MKKKIEINTTLESNQSRAAKICRSMKSKMAHVRLVDSWSSEETWSTIHSWSCTIPWTTIHLVTAGKETQETERKGNGDDETKQRSTKRNTEKYLMMPWIPPVCRTSEYQNEPRKKEALNFLLFVQLLKADLLFLINFTFTTKFLCSKKKRAENKKRRRRKPFSKTNGWSFLLLVNPQLSHDKNYTTSKLPPRKRKTLNKTLKT